MSSTLCYATALPRSVHALLRMSAGGQLRNGISGMNRATSLPIWSPPHVRSLSCSIAPLMAPRTPVISPEDEPNIVRSPYSDVEIPEINLADFVWKDVQKWPDNLALVSFEKQ